MVENSIPQEITDRYESNLEIAKKNASSVAGLTVFSEMLQKFRLRVNHTGEIPTEHSKGNIAFFELERNGDDSLSRMVGDEAISLGARRLYSAVPESAYANRRNLKLLLTGQRNDHQVPGLENIVSLNGPKYESSVKPFATPQLEKYSFVITIGMNAQGIFYVVEGMYMPQ